MISTIELGILSALITIFINYLIGKPGGDFSPDEIFSFYTIWLAKRRLKKLGLYKAYLEQAVLNHPVKHVRLEQRREFKILIYNAASPFFTWERALGMCAVCSGVWIALLTGVWKQNFFDLLVVVVISHIIIRIISKLI